MNGSMFEIFRTGAMALVTDTMAYTATHRKYGLSEAEWQLLTQHEVWTPEQRKQTRSIIAECVQITLTISGLPAQKLPGQYVAAVIASVVAPANRFVAAMRAPESYDAAVASGLQETFEVRAMDQEQMLSLVLAYSGKAIQEPNRDQLPKDAKGVDDDA